MKTNCLGSGAITLAACSLLAAGAPDGARWWSYVEFLASDKLEGRDTAKATARRWNSWRRNLSAMD
jgi:hypothetical protein